MTSPPTWHTANGATLPSPDSLTSSFKLAAPPKTDIWRRSPTDDAFSAPILYQKHTLSTFTSLTATVWAAWKTQYDQGGIVLVLPSTSQDKPSRWIKAGIEYFDNEPVLSVVGNDRFSDWSLAPLKAEMHQKATLKLEWDVEGATVWVYAVQDGEEKVRPLREIKWVGHVDAGEDGNGETKAEVEVWVGVYAAKPKVDAGDAEEVNGLEVSFSNVEIMAKE